MADRTALFLTHIRNRRGFTLMELLIAVSIIAILVAIGVASYSTVNKQSRDTKRKSDLEQVRSALEMYRAVNGYYPSAGSGSYVDASSGLPAYLVPGSISAIPSDPKSPTTVYMYQATTSVNGQYYGYCLSATLESETPASNPCTPYTAQNYSVKNP
jgi:prepilin-type N-terminal cleavage/methylation domain-containing protein